MPADDAPNRSRASGGSLRWEDPIGRVRGIGPRWAADLAERGVRTVGDLLDHLPFRYEDRRRPVPIAELTAGERAAVVARVADVRLIRTRGRRMEILTVLLDDGTATLPVKFFNRGYLAEWIRPGLRLVAYGTPRMTDRGLELHGPSFDVVAEGEDPQAVLGWLPVYEKLGPLTPRRLRGLLRVVLDNLEEIPDPVPEDVRERLGLIPRGDAYRLVHAPPGHLPAEAVQERRTPGHVRLAFDEFFLLELGLALRRRRTRRERRGSGYRIDDALRHRLLRLLPFELTSAQRRVLAEIEDDLARPSPMNRLLLGDVGSGKTVVAALAMMIAVENGYQAALMAPTEVLATQHARNLQKLLLPAGVKVELLTAGLPAAERRRADERVRTGRSRLIVGTHALVSEKTSFARLGLVVVDEQHRFGVVQRADLVAKGEHPDVLVMSATPIPRTLAMVIYGDLDVSILDEKPPGRKPIRTVVRTADQRERVMEGVARALAQGRRIYVVHPVIEEGAGGRRAAEEGLEEYRRRFPQANAVMVHGRMKAAERDRNLALFAEGKAQILIATTVIEVGIDVPEASVIVVEDADRFGLAQLHQLRGRVGRGELASYCVLIASPDASAAALERLAVLEATADGFRVAEKDLELRGPGELAGTAQSGMPSFKVADIVRHQSLLLAAREQAFELVERLGEGGLPEDLLREVMRRHGERLRLADIG
ncbi:MAG: ATP-dependent DNA helicase RecG [Acidobacteria bacterium]|nr:MAG: ATP-dependent DNA helicase RecG [Acidobacteriota bacterium]